MTATTASRTHMKDASTPGFGAALASEWTKLRSVRSTWIVIFLAITLSIGFSALIAFVQGFTYEDWGPAEQAVFDPLLNSTAGLLFGVVLLIVFGVMSVTSEYSSRMIRTTFIATPQRLRVYAAKATIVALIGLLVSIIITPGMFLISQVIFDAYGLETVTFGDEGVNRFMISYMIGVGLLYTLTPFALGFLLRGTASAITVSLGFFLLPWMIAPLMPSWIQENVLRFLPDLALDSLAGLTSVDSLMYLEQTPAIAVMAAWIIGSLIVSAVFLKKRDA
jgi:ABC-2 type transport system permease protein